MSTFLVICQDVARDTGVDASGTLPATTVSQTGDLLRIVNWVIQSWTEIQNRHNNWRFMRVGFTVTTTSADDSYAFGDVTDDLTSSAITRFSRWRINDPNDPPKRYLSATGVSAEGWLIYTTWDWFKRIYKIGTQNDSTPAHITVDPQDNIVLGPQPDDAYVISGDYQRSAQVLAADGDIPECPTQFHDLIKYMAMEKYAFYESAQEVLVAAQEGKNRIMRQLEANQLPEIYLGQPLA